MAYADVADPGAGPLSAHRVLLELLAVQRELLEVQYVRSADALENVAEAARRLGELPPAEGILDRAADELVRASEFGRALISEIVDGRIVALALSGAGRDSGAAAQLAELAQLDLRLEYPLLEQDVARTRRAQVVSVARAGARTPAPLARVLGWDGYVVAALTIGGETVGLLHADANADAGAGVDAGARGRGRALEPLDAEVAERYAAELSGVLERTVLRHTLELHRAQLGEALRWLGGRLSRLEDARALLHPRAGAGDLAVDSLTPREFDVLRLMARGQTNRAIAEALVVREGTIKYHVKNILRKLGARSRADAVARFVRAGGGEGAR